MSISKFISIFYKVSRISGDIKALQNGTLYKRIKRRIARKLF
ncbi:hypothetical protein [Metabacillus fastidiosus]